MNQGSKFLGDSFSNRYDIKASLQVKKEDNPSILKDEFSSIRDLSIFTSIAPVLLISSIELDSATFHAIRSKNVLTCHCAFRAYVFTCLACLCANVPYVFRTQVKTCLACTRGIAPACLACLPALKITAGH